MKFEQWNKFQPGDWQKEINVRDFIQNNYTPYEGDSSFLKGTTEKTQKLWDEVLELYKKEKESKGGVLDIDTKTVSTVAAHDAGYIDKDLEEIVDEFLESGVPYLQVAALTAIARNRIEKKLNTPFSANYIQNIASKIGTDKYVRLIFERLRSGVNIE